MSGLLPGLGILGVANQVCGIEKQKYTFFGPNIEPGCKSNVTYGTSSSMVVLSSASMILISFMPVVGMGLSGLFVVLCVLFTVLGSSVKKQ